MFSGALHFLAIRSGVLKPESENKPCSAFVTLPFTDDLISVSDVIVELLIYWLFD